LGPSQVASNLPTTKKRRQQLRVGGQLEENLTHGVQETVNQSTDFHHHQGTAFRKRLSPTTVKEELDWASKSKAKKRRKGEFTV